MFDSSKALIISQETTLRNLVSKVDPNFDISSDSAISDNLLKFEVFFQDLNYELMQEFEEYPVIFICFILISITKCISLLATL